MVTKSHVVQVEELQQLLEVKRNELYNANKISSEKNHAMHDVTERLSATVQSCNEANEIISSQKASINELKEQLNDEREQRREERDKAVTDLKVAVQKVQFEGQEELKRVSDTSLRRENELQEVITKLQELEKERCFLVETLRTKLEDTRQKLVAADNRAHQLQSQLSEEQGALENEKKRAEELEHEVKRVVEELDCEKVAREEAWKKVSTLELKITAAVSDLDFEKRKLKDARERIMLRETQLRSFYSTTEEISVLFAKQQEQLKSMQRTLEDEDNYENCRRSASPDPTPSKAGSSASTQKVAGTPTKVTALTEEASATEKQDCNGGSPVNSCNMDNIEFASSEPGLCYDMSHPYLMGTEKVPETESPDYDMAEKKVDDTHDFDLESEKVQTVEGEAVDDSGRICMDEGQEMAFSEVKIMSSGSDDTADGCDDTDDDDDDDDDDDGSISDSVNEEFEEGEKEVEEEM